MRTSDGFHIVVCTWQRSLVALCVMLATPHVYGATLTAACTGTTGDTTALTSAITNANDEGLHPGADKIVLTAGCTYALSTIDNAWYGPNGLPAISSVITIEGNGATISRSTAVGIPNFRLFYVSGELSELLAGRALNVFFSFFGELLRETSATLEKLWKSHSQALTRKYCDIRPVGEIK